MDRKLLFGNKKRGVQKSSFQERDEKVESANSEINVNTRAVDQDAIFNEEEIALPKLKSSNSLDTQV